MAAGSIVIYGWWFIQAKWKLRLWLELAWKGDMKGMENVPHYLIVLRFQVVPEMCSLLIFKKKVIRWISVKERLALKTRLVACKWTSHVLTSSVYVRWIVKGWKHNINERKLCKQVANQGFGEQLKFPKEENQFLSSTSLIDTYSLKKSETPKWNRLPRLVPGPPR